MTRSVFFRFFVFANIFLVCACGGGRSGKLRVFDLTDRRVADLSVVKKVVGKNEFMFFSRDVARNFLEGYIQGNIIDYNNNPIEGVVVRVVPENARNPEKDLDTEAQNITGFETISFDPGVSDTNGFYRIRFSLPILDDKVDMRGTILYNPGWEQQKSNLGYAYEPQAKETPFHFYFESKTGVLAFSEGIRQSVVQPVSAEDKAKSSGLPGGKAPVSTPAQAPAKNQPAKSAGDEDPFKGFSLE